MRLDANNDSNIDALLKYCRTSAPSDRVCIDVETDEAMFNIWEKSFRAEETKYAIPSDLFFANTIPLADCEIVVDETGKSFDRGNGLTLQGYAVKYRVVTLNGKELDIMMGIYDKILKNEPLNSDELRPLLVGAVIINPPELPGSTVYLPFYVSVGCNYLFSIPNSSFVVKNGLRAYLKDITINDEKTQREFEASFLYEHMRTWYSIQVSLLNPKIKEAYKTVDPRISNSKKRASKKTKRLTKLIRRMYINADDIENVINPNKKEFNRKTLAWYVCGHFRHYKNGNVIFIQPYWKGILRDVQRNLDEGRDRLMAV